MVYCRNPRSDVVYCAFKYISNLLLIVNCLLGRSVDLQKVGYILRK